MGEQLNIYKIKDKGYYFRDEKLEEYRNVFDFTDRLFFEDVPNDMLEKNTEEDARFLVEKGIFPPLDFDKIQVIDNGNRWFGKLQRMWDGI